MSVLFHSQKSGFFRALGESFEFGQISGSLILSWAGFGRDKRGCKKTRIKNFGRDLLLSADFKSYPNPRNSPLGTWKVKNYHKIKSKSNVRIEGNIENESCSTTWVDHKTFFWSNLNPKNRPLGLQKVKMTPRLSQIQKSELKES